MDSTPVTGDDSIRIRADLIRRGRLIPASDPTSSVLPTDQTDLSTDSTDIISDLREERL